MEKNFKFYFFLIVFIVVVGLNLYLLSPLFHTFVFATIVSSVFYPIFNYLVHKKKFSRKPSAIVCTFAILLTIVLPSIYVVTQLTKESVEIYQNIRGDLNKERIKGYFIGEGKVAQVVEKSLGLVKSDMSKADFYNLVVDKARGYLGSVVKVLKGLITDFIYLIFQFSLMLIFSYSLFLSGGKLKDFFFKLSPLPVEQKEKVLSNYNQMNFVTLIGNGLGGVIQGILAGLAFWMAGVPSVFLWTTFMIILAFIPIIGMSVVFIPATIYLVIMGKTFAGIALFTWCMLVSLVVENVFKPKFVGDRLQVNGILLFFYIVAGMSVFGALGLFYGPILCIIFLTFSEIFITNYSNNSYQLNKNSGN